MGYVHSIKEHDKLVNKLMHRIEIDYNEFRDDTLSKLSKISIPEDAKDTVVNNLATRFSVLSYVKQKILDDEGNILKGFGQRVSEKEAEYFIDTVEFNILINSEINFCKRLESYVQTIFIDKICNGFESAQMLNTITDVNFGHIVSVLEKVDYKNKCKVDTKN